MKQLVLAMRFFKEKVYDRLILLETASNIFAAYIKYQLPKQSLIEIHMKN